MKKYFLAGLVTLLPLAVTFWVVDFILRFLTKPFQGIVSAFLTKFSHNIPAAALSLFSEILILIFLFFFIFFLGFVARRFFFNRILALGDKILDTIPLVNKVYKTSKDIVNSLFSTTNKSFKQVVLIHFPYQGCYCLGLIASNVPTSCSKSIPNEPTDQSSPSLENDKVSVFIPTAPNPTTGYLIMSKKSDLIYLKMSSEDAMKYVVSCAVISPETIKPEPR